MAVEVLAGAIVVEILTPTTEGVMVVEPEVPLQMEQAEVDHNKINRLQVGEL